MGASQTFAKRDIADQQGKRAHADRQHDDIKHDNSTGIAGRPGRYENAGLTWFFPAFEIEKEVRPPA
jgi:hypothetical protein